MTQPTPADLEAYRAALSVIGPVAPSVSNSAIPLLRVRQLDRGAYVLRAGDEARDVAFVVLGVLREYFPLPNGTERTKSFVVEGQTSGSLADLLSGKPSRASIVAEEPTRILIASWQALRELARDDSGWAEIGSRYAERLVLRKAQREYELLALDAEARYARFREDFPGLEARIAAKHVASYVGITPVHLSRLRRRRRGPSEGE